MFSVPLICSSNGVATVLAMVSGLAPGKSAVTTTDGGTTSGYSEIGNCIMAIRPARKMAIEITPAKMGRSMKNLDRFMSAFSPEATWSVAGGLPRRCGGHRRAGTEPLQPVKDHVIPGLESRRHHPLAVDLGAQR